MSSNSIYRTWNEVLGYYSIGLAVAGTVGNFIASGICMRKSLRKVPTFVFYGVMCIANAFSLYAWNFNVYFLTFYGLSPADFDIWSCRFVQFIQMTFSQSSSFLLIAMTLERYLSVKIRVWRKSMFNAKKALIASLSIVLFFFLFNVHMLFTLPFKPVANKSRASLCVSSDIFKTWRSMHTYIYSMAPFVLLFIIDCFMIYEVIRSSRMKKISAKSKSMSISVIAFTIAFFILTAPHAVMGGYFLVQLRSTELGLAANSTVIAVAYTFHGTNLILLLCSNTRFYEEFKTILREMKILKETYKPKSTSTNINTTNI